jgi:23S rRNA (cytosine1962-C5)-methyltransferase
MQRITLTTESAADYELLDSGRAEKLEKYGDVVLVRPDPQALWEKSLPQSVWDKADAKYTREGKEGEWQVSTQLPKEWQIAFGGFTFAIRPSSFKHTGIFPEQLSNWQWAKQRIQEANRPISVLNLFAYTGGATLACASAGAEVTHVDASKTAVAWARENAKLSGLEDEPIRWIIEDVLVFLKREIKRGKRYDAIIMDPPAFGHGSKNELWKIEENFYELLELCEALLSPQPLFVLINAYAAGYSPLAFAYNLERFVKKYKGSIEYGDLTIQGQGSSRSLPCGIFARWMS